MRITVLAINCLSTQVLHFPPPIAIQMITYRARLSVGNDYDHGYRLPHSCWERLPYTIRVCGWYGCARVQPPNIDEYLSAMREMDQMQREQAEMEREAAAMQRQQEQQAAPATP